MNKLSKEQIEKIDLAIAELEACLRRLGYTNSNVIDGLRSLRAALTDVEGSEENKAHHYSPDATTAMNCLVCGKSKWMHTN